MEDTWKGIQISGRGAFVLKEKLKVLKGKLKSWNYDVFGDLHKKRKEAVEKLNEIEKEAEESQLQEEDLQLRRECEAEFWRCASRIETLMHQKSRINWVKVGDENSK